MIIRASVFPRRCTTSAYPHVTSTTLARFRLARGTTTGGLVWSELLAGGALAGRAARGVAECMSVVTLTQTCGVLDCGHPDLAPSLAWSFDMVASKAECAVSWSRSVLWLVGRGGGAAAAAAAKRGFQPPTCCASLEMGRGGCSPGCPQHTAHGAVQVLVARSRGRARAARQSQRGRDQRAGLEDLSRDHLGEDHG